MHFVFGGAFNGKSKWVKVQYNKRRNVKWLSAYDQHFRKKAFEETDTFEDIIILQGVEQYIKACIDVNQEADNIRKNFNEQCEIWLEWEKGGSARKLIVIGNDLSKGVVPIAKEDRLWRDLTGWCYQDLAAKSERIDLIWYGISKRLK